MIIRSNEVLPVVVDESAICVSVAVTEPKDTLCVLIAVIVHFMQQFNDNLLKIDPNLKRLTTTEQKSANFSIGASIEANTDLTDKPIVRNGATHGIVNKELRLCY